jgi:hypothetical protein
MGNMAQRAADRRQNERGNEEASPGYSINGEGVWTRHAAGGGSVDTITATNTKERQEWSRLDVQIRNTAKTLAQLERRVMDAPNIEARTKARERAAKTRTMLERMRAEQRGGCRPAITVPQ